VKGRASALRSPSACDRQAGGATALLPQCLESQMDDTTTVALDPPREAGRGDRPQGGGGGQPRRPAFRPLHHASHGPPPPSLRDGGGSSPAHASAKADTSRAIPKAWRRSVGGRRG
jgi:hypothetical protein